MGNPGTADEEVKGWTLGQLGEVLAIIARALGKALNGRNYASFIVKLGKNGKILSRSLSKIFDEIENSIVFLLTLGGSFSTSELIRKGGYDWFNDWITDERFPIQKHEPVERRLEFVEFDYDPSSEDVLKEFESRGLERPTYEDALYFGIEHPEEQRKRPIIFLHEPVLDPRGDRSVLVLNEDGGKRKLNLGYFDGGWGRGCVFPGVCKN